MTARQRIPALREELTAVLGRRPTLTEMSEHLGCTRERVRQVYMLLGYDTREGVSQRTAKRARRRELDRSVRAHAREAQRADILDLLDQNLTQQAVAEIVGVSQSFVSKVMLEDGQPPRRRLFTVSEDVVLIDYERDEHAVARKLDRDPRVVQQRRRRLQRAPADRVLRRPAQHELHR